MEALAIRHCACAAVCLAALPLTIGAAAPPQATTPPTNAVVAAATHYLTQYEQDVSAIVAEEDYLQQGPQQQSRRLRSDFLVIRHERYGWIEFRDVFDVDGRPVRDREQRLANLFMRPRPDAFDQAARIVDEAARFNLGALNRTINTPLTALRFLTLPNVSRSDFRLDPSRSRGDVAVLTFREQAKPRLLFTRDDAPARGTFWIEPASGRVMASELMLTTYGTATTLEVKFAEEPRLKIWLPASMDELYLMRSGTIAGRARYSNFRKFRVETTTEIGRH